MTRSFLVRAVGIAALLLVTGCATVPKASDRLAQQSRTFVPPPGKANVYVIRPYNYIGSGLRWTVTLDSIEFGNLGLRSYLYGVVEPGEHVVGSLPPQVGGSPNQVGFAAVEGRNYFFKVSPGVLGYSVDIEPLDEQAGRSRVLDYTPSGDNRFELLESQSPLR